MIKANITVLMTACIAPEPGISSKPGSRLQRADPAIRFNDYAAGLAFWLNHPDPRIDSIVFADNSRYDLSELHALVQRSNSTKRVELLSLPVCQWPEHVHYGYCELQIIDQALRRSTALSDTEYFIKATGRLQFGGLTRLLDRLPDRLSFAVDCHRSLFHSERGGAATQLMFFNREFYLQNLLGVNAKLEPWVISHIEDLLFRELTRFEGTRGAVLRWPVDVRLIGVSATTNSPYSSIRNRIKLAIRGATRAIAPWLWV